MSGDRLLSWRSYWLFSLAHLMLVLPLAPHILWLFYPYLLFALLYRAGMVAGRLPPLRRGIALLISLSGIGGMLLMVQQTGVLEALINLLLLAYALKFVEMRRRRDLHVLVLLGFFCAGVNFVFSESIPFTLYLFAALMCNCAGLMALERDDDKPVQTLIGTGWLFLHSLPLMLVLFLLMPRTDPLWRVPEAASTRTGLSEEVAPGDIARLSRDSRLAFRAILGDVELPPQQLYWRAMTHEVFDGDRWRIHPRLQRWREQSIRVPQMQLQETDDLIAYELLIEPHDKHWLFSLDLSQLISADARPLPDFSWRAEQPVVRKRQLRAIAHPATLVQSQEPAEVLHANLMLPTEGNARSRTLGEQLAADNPRLQDRINAALNFFKSHPFAYSLNPPALPEEHVDAFLFDTQTGFCIHYAGAFTYLMRAAGIPARVVSGYQGGERHPSGTHYSIYQFDAHAWSEVWLEGRGWLRIDPTALIAPDRIVSGLEDALDEPGAFRLLDPLALVRYRDIAWINFLRNQWQLMDYHWTRWVVSFDQQKQVNLLRHLLGATDSVRLAALLLGSLLVVALLIWLSLKWRQPSRQRSREQRLFARACSKLARRGCAIRSWETAQQYQQRVNESVPERGERFALIAALYQRLRYEEINSEQKNALRRQLAAAVRAL